MIRSRMSDENRIISTLIEMGGGIGPVKPGNQIRSNCWIVGAKSGSTLGA